MDKRIRKMVLSALFAALCCIMTIVVQIPAPTGYVNLGDCAVLIGAWVLGPAWGAAAAGLGCALADVLNGWASYAVATMFIKAAMAAVASAIYRGGARKGRFYSGMIGGAIPAEVIMVAGYYLYESRILGVGAAAVASIPANLVQGIVCMLAAVTAAALMERGHVLKPIK